MPKAPGKAHREGLTLLEVASMFGTEEKARAWVEELRWPDGPHCPHCGSFNVQCNIKHKSQTHRCRDCDNKPMFTARVGTIMHRSHLTYQEWAIGLYLYTTNLKGISSMRLHRELGISQKAAWFLLHRLRKASETGEVLFSGLVEADETYFGGKRKNMSNSKRRELKDTGRGTVGKTAVAGVKDRDSNSVKAKVVENTDAATLVPFVENNTAHGATVYTDEAKAYKNLPSKENGIKHEAVCHSVAEYVRDQAHTNGLESFWASVKRGHDGIYHKMSPKHLQRYVDEFSTRHNIRDLNTLDQMMVIASGMIGKRLKFADLIADNGMASGART